MESRDGVFWVAVAATPFSLTVMRTGFLRPALTSFSSSCVCVAENKPVRLCLGRYPRMVLRLGRQAAASYRKQKNKGHYR